MTCNRTTAIGTDRAVITSYDKTSTGCKNILERISAVSAHFQDSAVEPYIWIHVRRFKVKIVLEAQLRCVRRKRDGQRVEPFVAD